MTEWHLPMNTLALHHILVNSEILAHEVAKELELGADFGYLAQEYSVCPSATNQGYAGQHRTDALPTALLRALFEPTDNKGPYVGPVHTEFGFHIVKPVNAEQHHLLIDE